MTNESCEYPESDSKDRIGVKVASNGAGGCTPARDEAYNELIDKDLSLSQNAKMVTGTKVS